MSSRFYLLVLDGDRTGEEIDLAADRFTIGRKDKNDLVLPDTRVSGFHAEVVQEGGAWILRDLGSTNGTLLDGRKVDEVPLSHGDFFAVGLIRLRFVDREGGPLAAESEEVQVARVDQDLLRKVGRRRSVLPLVLLLLVVGGGGTYLFLLLQDGGPKGGRSRPPLEVAGNLLAAKVGAMEEDGQDAWLPADEGEGFIFGQDRPNTGKGCYSASLAPDRPRVLTLARPVAIGAETTLEAGVHIRLAGTDAKVAAALQLIFHDQASGQPFHISPSRWLGTAARYTRLTLKSQVPPDCDKATLRLVVRGAKGRVSVDDAFLRGVTGEANGATIHPQMYQTAALVHDEAMLAVAQARTGRLLTIGPALLPPGKLQARDLAAAATQVGRSFSGAGMRLLAGAGSTAQVVAKVEAANDGARVGWTCSGTEGAGTPHLVWAVPEGPTLVEIPGPGGKGVTGVRLKSGRESVMVRWDEALPLVVTRIHAGRRWCAMPMPAGPVTIKVGFGKERLQAAALLQEAKDALAEQRTGAALGLLRKLLDEVPYNEQAVLEARDLVNRVTAKAQKVLGELQARAEKSEIFASPRELSLLLEEVEAIKQEYAGYPLVIAGAGKVATAAREQLAVILAAEEDREFTRLQGIVKALGDESVPLRKLIEDYIDRYLPAARERARTAGPVDKE